MMDLRKPIELAPHIAKDRPTWSVLQALAKALTEVDWRCETAVEVISRLRELGDKGLIPEVYRQELRVCSGVLCDLRAQGWSFEIRDSSIMATEPATESDPMLEKARIRAGLLIERDRDLHKSSVRDFIRKMETRRLTTSGWFSVHDLMRDGQALAQDLGSSQTGSGGFEGLRKLKEAVDPYVQLVDDSRCSLSGYPLKDIWRYFRYTWVTPHKTIPGRNIWFLVRDRASANHPVVGIAALGSASVRLGVRDEAIGWDADTVVGEITENPTSEWASWIERTLAGLVGNIYTIDLLEEGILESDSAGIEAEDSIGRLRRFAAEERERHRAFPYDAKKIKDARGAGEVDWVSFARTHLYRSKRAGSLATLLEIRRKLRRAGLHLPTASDLGTALESASARGALATLIRRQKATRVGSDILDITVCGAVAPYNELLGGKLVALLLTSPEIVSAYGSKYSARPAIIASAMAGRPVSPDPRLVYLCTTGLYGVGSSQYNRLRMPISEVDGTSRDVIRFENLGPTKGYGSYQFSSLTTGEMNTLLAQRQAGRRVNRIFGEGVSPRMRMIREALELVGLPADPLLIHGNPRVVYGIPLASNTGRFLLGLDNEPVYRLPQDDPVGTTDLIADYWRSRWLAMRVKNKEVLARVERHSLTNPIRHGACVHRPSPESEAQSLLFD